MNAGTSLRNALESFIKDSKTVNALIQEYHNLTLVNPHWRIGGFISIIRKRMAV